MVGMCNRLSGEAEIEFMQAEIADEDCDENGDEAPQQVQILEHHRVAQTADHADTGFLCQRANNQRDQQRDQERRVLGAGAFLRELEQRGNSQEQDQQADHDSGQHRAVERLGGVVPLKREALADEDRAKEDTGGEAGQTDNGVQIAASQTQHHAQRAAEKGQRADHDECAEHKAERGRRTGSGFPFLRGQRHQEAAEHKTDDLRADILDLGSRMQTHSACDVALKARDAEAHVGRVAERRQHECCDADDNTGQNDEQVFFFHVLFPPI